MADSLVLTGVKGVKKHTGTEMMLTRPKRGGDTHSVKEWWRNGVSAVYATCTIFDVTTAAGTVKLVLDTSAGTNVRIDHDGSFNFTFYHPNEIKRGALYTDNMELIEHYVFPSISGGKVMTVTPAGAATRPGGGPPPAPTPDVTVTIDSVNGTDGYILSGDATGENATINVTSGDLLSITNNTGSHPLYIKSALGAGNSGQIADGSVTGQGVTNGEVLWDTDGFAPGTYYYQCQLHEDMNGEIIVA